MPTWLLIIAACLAAALLLFVFSLAAIARQDDERWGRK